MLLGDTNLGKGQGTIVRLENVPICLKLIQHYFLESLCAEVTLKSVFSSARSEPMPGCEVGTSTPEKMLF